MYSLTLRPHTMVYPDGESDYLEKEVKTKEFSSLNEVIEHIEKTIEDMVVVDNK